MRCNGVPAGALASVVCDVDMRVPRASSTTTMVVAVDTLVGHANGDEGAVVVGADTMARSGSGVGGDGNNGGGDGMNGSNAVGDGAVSGSAADPNENVAGNSGSDAATSTSVGQSACCVPSAWCGKRASARRASSVACLFVHCLRVSLGMFRSCVATRSSDRRRRVGCQCLFFALIKKDLGAFLCGPPTHDWSHTLNACRAL